MLVGLGQKIELHVSSNVYIDEVCSIVTKLEEWSKSDYYLLSDMAINMKKHFDYSIGEKWKMLTNRY